MIKEAVVRKLEVDEQWKRVQQVATDADKPQEEEERKAD